MPPVPSSGVVIAGEPVDERPAGDRPDDDTRGAAPGERERTRRLNPWVLWGALLALIVLPIVVAVIALHGTHWYPVLDLAMTEVRVRDVGTSATPLIGLPGRIGRTLMEQGSHPGPLSFYSLAPGYRLFGSSAWAMEAATALLDVIAIGASLAIAKRRGGTPLLLAVAVLLAFLVRGYGMGTLTEAWNPYMPLLWWVLFLLAVWSVFCADFKMFPVLVFAGSFCAQTHMPYLGSTIVLAGLSVAVALFIALRTPRGSKQRRNLARWGLAGAVLAAALWAPLVVDQVRNSPGNLSIISDYFRNPPKDEPPVGLAKGVQLELLHLDLSRIANDQAGDTGSLVNASESPNGSVIPGLIVLAVWGVAVAAAWRMRHRELLRLHAVVGVSMILAVISMSRIFGHIWYYLMLWSWGITGLLLLSVGWTAVAWWNRRHRAERHRLLQALGAVAIGLIVVSTVSLTVSARDTSVPAPELSRVLADLMPKTMDALLQHKGTATGRDGRYSVTMTDALYIGSQGYGIVLDLERNGFHAGMPKVFHVPMTDTRVVEPADATAVIHLATGPHVDEWRAKPYAVEVGYIDPRSPAQRAEYDRLRADALQRIQAAGWEDLVPLVDGNLFAAAIDDRLTPELRDDLQTMLDLGMPTAIFLAPPGTLD